MSNNTIKLKLRSLEYICSKTIKYIFSGLLGYIISKASIFGISPFSVSLLSVIPFFEISLIATYLGVFIGLISNSFSPLNLKYLAINSLLTLSILICGKNNYKNNIYSFVLPGVLTFAGGMIYIVFSELSIINILICLAESTLACCCAYFIKYSGQSLVTESRLDIKDIISINLTVNIILLSLKEYLILGISLSIVLVITILYICSYFLPFKFTALFITPLCLALNVFGIINKTGLMAILISCIFTSFISKLERKYIVPSFFIVFSTIISLYEFSFESVKLILSPLLSGILFVIIPKKQTASILNQFIELKDIPEKTSPVADVLCDKFNENTYKLTNTISKQTLAPIITTEIKNKLIKKYSTVGFKNVEVINFYNKSGKQLIDINFNTKKKPDFEIIEAFLEKYTDQTFKLIESKNDNENYHYKFEQQDNYIVDCYALFKAKNDESVCGDSICAFKSSKSYYSIILADGMGSGKDAYIKSKNSVSLIKKLLISGVSPKKAIATVNTSMLLLNDELGFSTIDLCNISLKTGLAEIYKCGAYLSLIARNNSISKILGGGFPAGLEDNSKPVTEQMQLINNDILVMLSDGVSSAIEYVEAELLLNVNNSIEIIAKRILSSAYENTPEKFDDDMSVVVCKIIEK